MCDRFVGAGLILGTILMAGSASAYDAYDQKNCNGVDWDDKRGPGRVEGGRQAAAPISSRALTTTISKPRSVRRTPKPCRKEVLSGRPAILVLTGKTRRRLHLRFHTSRRRRKAGLDPRAGCPVTALQPVKPTSDRRRRPIGSAPGRIRAATSRSSKSPSGKLSVKGEDGRSDGASTRTRAKSRRR